MQPLDLLFPVKKENYKIISAGVKKANENSVFYISNHFTNF